MARFFSHVQGHRGTIDTDGLELPSLNAARHEAIRCAARRLEDEHGRFAQAEDWPIPVADLAGLVVYELQFCVTEPADLPSA